MTIYFTLLVTESNHLGLKELVLSGHEELCMLFTIQFDGSVPGDYAIDRNIKITALHSR